MSGFVGANPAELRALANVTHAKSRHVLTICRAVDQALSRAGWEGKDAQEFKHEWTTRLRSNCKEAASLLEDMAKTLRRNAQEQEIASESDGPIGQCPVPPTGPRFPLPPIPPIDWDREIRRMNREPLIRFFEEPMFRPIIDHFSTYETKASWNWGKDGELIFTSKDGKSWSARILEGQAQWGKDYGTEYKSDDGKVTAEVKAFEGAKIDAHATAGTGGFGAKVAALVGIEGSASGKVQLAEHAAIGGTVGAAAGLMATGELKASSTGVKAQGEAFAGAKVKGQAGAEVGGIYGGIKAEGWAGVGIGGDVKFGMEDDGKFHVGAKGGVAVGLGGSLGFEIAADPKEIVETVSDVGSFIKTVNPGPIPLLR